MALRLLIDDGMQITLGTGIGKYSKYLYEALDRRDDVEVSLLNWHSETHSRGLNRIEYLRYINSRQFRKDVQEYDAVLFTNYAVPFRKLPCKTVCCIPDMVSFLYPDTLPVAYRFYNRAMVRNSMRKADLILTISETVKNEISNRFPKQANKVAFTWLGLYKGIHKASDFAPYEDEKLRDLSPDKFFLFVSTVEKRKNVGLVLDAFLQLKAEGKADGFQMVFAGRLGYGSDEFLQTARASEYRNDIIFTGYVTDNDLNHLYNEAAAFVFPTVYEGFGFAQIECMSVGLPIILSDIPTNREISRDYGVYFDLGDKSTLIKAMNDVARGKIDRNRLNALAEKYLPEFNWDEIAKQYIQIISCSLEVKA